MDSVAIFCGLFVGDLGDEFQRLSASISLPALDPERVQQALKRLNGGWTSTYASMCFLDRETANLK